MTLKKPAALLIILLISFFAFDSAHSQDDLTLETVDSVSYELYKNYEWNKLIRFGNRAIADGIDFYSLRLRLGTAYYKIKNYFRAIDNFEKALGSGIDDPLIYEFLYFSYMFTGRVEDKNFVFSKLPESKKEILRPLYNIFIDNIFAEGGTGISNDPDNNSLTLTNSDIPENSYGEQIIFGDYLYFKGGIYQLPFDRLNVTYEYSYYNLKKKQQIFTNSIQIGTGESNEYNQTQNRFYNSFDILVAKGLVISPAGHYINSKDNRRVFDSIYHSSDSLIHFNFSNKEFNIENFILSLGVSKYFSKYRAGISGSFSQLSEKHQSQFALLFSGFPFGNNKFYTETNATLHIEETISNVILTQLFGVTVLKNLNLQASATFGKVKNFNEQNGHILYNDDLIKFKFASKLVYDFNYNFIANIGFDYQDRERNFNTYSVNPDNSIFRSESKKIDYNVIRLYAGLKFYF